MRSMGSCLSALVALKIGGKVSWCRQALSDTEVTKDAKFLHVLNTDSIRLYEKSDSCKH